MIMLKPLSVDDPRLVELIEEVFPSSVNWDDVWGMLESLEGISTFADLKNGGLNVNVTIAVDESTGTVYEDVAFLASMKFTLDGYVYFSNGVFAVSLREHFDVLREVADSLRS